MIPADIEKKLNLTYYKGEDLYCDGEIEDEILHMVQTHETYEEILKADDRWPVLYHLSKVRHNLLDWMDFGEHAHVLEIGSGCGAMTGVLCEKAEFVQCVELSKKRSLINANRNRKYENFEIMVGNFEDVVLPEKYDVITLIGVLEYSPCYIKSEQPFDAMLAKIKEMLKPGGILIIAIENRFGLKYFAGAMEDHTGGFYDGISGYKNVDFVQTFTKPELARLLTRNGYGNQAFYYPMPDYKLPSVIYSDAYLPKKGDIRSISAAYDRKRYKMFDEEAVYDQLCEDGMIPYMANSFLVVAGGDEADVIQKNIYAKYNRGRNLNFQIATMVANQPEHNVYKKAIEKTAIPHVQAMKENKEQLDTLFLHTTCVAGTWAEESVSFDYVQGTNLKEQLLCSMKNMTQEAFMQEVRNTLDDVFASSCEPKEFAATSEFEKVFGQTTLTGAAFEISNIDMIFDNLIKVDEGYVCIDYEWVFRFAIPVDYLKYRSLDYFYKFCMDGHTTLTRTQFFVGCGLKEGDIEGFDAMEAHFQDYVFGDADYMRRYVMEMVDYSDGMRTHTAYMEGLEQHVENLEAQLAVMRPASEKWTRLVTSPPANLARNVKDKVHEIRRSRAKNRPRK